MDSDHFDALSTLLGQDRSRRGLGALLAGFAAGGVLPPLFEVSDIEAKKKKKKKKKQRGCDCQQGQMCVNKTCVTGAGTCAAGATTCGRLSNDPLTCNNAPACACRQSASGQTRCGKDPIGELCGQCTTDAQCASFGLGAFCVLATTTTPGVFCACPALGQGFCQLPC